jgi:hypothetical protein
VGRQATAGLECESKLGSSLRTGPIGGSRLAVRERKGRREGSGLGRWAGKGGVKRPARQCGEERKEGKERVGETGWVRYVGWAKRRKRKMERKKCIQMHLNLNLNFKFK